MPPPYAQEFTNELGSNYLASLLNPIEENERENVGKAESESRAGGLGAQAETGSEIAGVEENSQLHENSAISGFNLDVAQKQYGERMTDEEQAFRDTEAQKQRDFQQQMEAAGFAHEDAMAAGAKHAAEQGQILGIAGEVGGAAVGGFFGGPAGAMAGAAAGKSLAAMASPAAAPEDGEVGPPEDTSVPEDEDAWNQIGEGDE